ncbi:MAG: CBS domain-containing protein, partial [Pseudomonadota bacterium]
LVGLLDEEDLLLHVYDTGGFKGNASDIMTADLRTVSADEDLARVLLLLTRGMVVPVIHNGKFQGLITKIDVLNHMRLAAG